MIGTLCGGLSVVFTGVGFLATVFVVGALAWSFLKGVAKGVREVRASRQLTQRGL